MLEVLLPHRTHNVNTYVGKHSHPNYELLYFFGGHIKTNISGEEFDITKNTLVLYSPSTIHDEFYYEKSVSIVLRFQFESSFVLPPYLVLKDHNLIYEKYLTEILQEFNFPDVYSKNIIENVIYKIMVLLSRDFSSENKNEQNLEDIISYIDKFYTAKLQINDLAKKSFYSAGHFRILFKEKTGMLPKDYILKKKLTLAENMLTNSDTALIVIAETCGFENYSQFSLFFKKKNKISPKQYRKMYSKF